MQIHAPSRKEPTLLLIAKRHARALALAAVFVVSATQAHAQGCVVARGGGASAITESGGYLQPGHWELNFAYRHFLSGRHFVGDDEQTQRETLHNEVINHSNFADINVAYGWSQRLNITLALPYSWHDRSQVSSGVRASTQANGIGDIRLGASYWVMNPESDHQGNLSVGFGIKAPTGKANAQDFFSKPTGGSVNYVDSSIQPGDGAWGATVEMQGFYHLMRGLSLYGNGFYLLNPDERNEQTGWSIPDGYMVRGGFDYRVDAVKGLVLSAGLRNEGVVAHDLFGGNLGRRRPGFAVSFEPGISFSRGRYSGALTVPIAIHRNRVVSFGSAKAGDAAFADYTVNTSFSIRL